MSTESTARTPLPYRFVRLWVSTIVVFSIAVTLGFERRAVGGRKIDLWPHPGGGGEFAYASDGTRNEDAQADRAGQGRIQRAGSRRAGRDFEADVRQPLGVREREHVRRAVRR